MPEEGLLLVNWSPGSSPETHARAVVKQHLQALLWLGRMAGPYGSSPSVAEAWALTGSGFLGSRCRDPAAHQNDPFLSQ